MAIQTSRIFIFSKKLEEQEMLTEEQRKSRKLLLAAKYPALVIRIVLPDRLILQVNWPCILFNI